MTLFGLGQLELGWEFLKLKNSQMNKLGLSWAKLRIAQLWLSAVNNCKAVEIKIFN